jgi:hypothetical protein
VPVPRIPEPVGELAASQHGLLTGEQLRRWMSDAAVRQRVARGQLIRVHPAVYAVPGAPWTWRQRLLAACLTRPGTVVSHWAAAELWQLGAHRPSRVIVTFDARAPVRRLRIDRVEVHESRFLDGVHVGVIDGIPVTSAARTALDLSGFAAPRTVARYVDEGLRRGHSSIPQLVAVFDDLATRGRRRSTVMRTIVERRLEGFHPGDSDAEVDVVQAILDAGLPRPVQQHEVVVRDRTYRLDVCYPDLKIDIEFDSFDFHRPRGPFDEDRQRERRLVLTGWTVVRYTSADTAAEIAATVREAIELARRRSA